MSPREAAWIRAVSNTVQIAQAHDLRGIGTGLHVTITQGRKKFSCIVTAAHVLPTRAQARRATCVFPQVDSRYPRREVAFDTVRLYLNCSPHLDVALVALARNVVRAPPPPLYPPPRPYSDTHKEVVGTEAEVLHVLHHGGGAPRVGLTTGRLVVALETAFAVAAPAMPGCSGAPVFTSAFRVYGIVIAENNALLHLQRRDASYTQVTEAQFLDLVLDALKKRGMAIANPRE